MLSFLVEHNANFSFDPTSETYTALVQIFPPGTDINQLSDEDSDTGEGSSSSSSSFSAKRGKKLTPAERSLLRISGTARRHHFKPKQRIAHSMIPFQPISEKLQAVQEKLQARFPMLAKELSDPMREIPKPMAMMDLGRFIDDVYAERYMAETLRLRLHAIEASDDVEASKRARFLARPHNNFGKTMMLVVKKHRGIQLILEQFAWRVAFSVEKRRATSDTVELFARFLDGSFDDIDLLFFLQVRDAARNLFQARKWDTIGNGAPNSPLGRLNHLRPTDINGHRPLPTPEEAAGGMKREAPPIPIKDEAKHPVSARDAIRIVRDAVDPKQLQEMLLRGRVDAKMQEAKASSGKDELALHTVLFLLTEEYHAARGELGSLPSLEASPVDQTLAATGDDVAGVLEEAVADEELPAETGEAAEGFEAAAFDETLADTGVEGAGEFDEAAAFDQTLGDTGVEDLQGELGLPDEAGLGLA